MNHARSSRKSPGATALAASDIRTGLSKDAFKRAFLDNLFYVQARFPEVASRQDCYMALAHTVRDRMLDRWVQTARTYKDQGSRTVCYLSAEFLIGPQLANNLLNLGLTENCRQAIEELGLDFDALVELDEEPGLGNGGLGRLAACYLDSLATLQIPAIGYGIRYEFGIFQQSIRDGQQVELTDKWLRFGNPWQIYRPGIHFDVGLGGRTEAWTDERGRYRVRWLPDHLVRGVAHDMPVLGHGVATANLLRLWSAEAPESFHFEAFNTGDYYGAVVDKVFSETLSKVLYPNDEPEAGKQLRLEQQYFFVSCSLRDMIRLHRQRENNLDGFAAKFAVQLNDTHPSIAVAELMRLLVDEHLMDWGRAWDITTRCFAYTNHTLLPEALEKWPVPLFSRVLPRHYEIILEINRRFLDAVAARHPGDGELLQRVSLIDESGPRYVRMAHLATVGSHAVNGVAALHSELLKREVMSDFHALAPEKFLNVTNGVTPRRFLALCNPGLKHLIDEAIGQGWLCNLDRLRELEPFAEDAAFRERWRGVKLANKTRLAAELANAAGVLTDPGSLYDIQVKRIHEYKRQQLNALRLVAEYIRIKAAPGRQIAPRTVIFGGKAAPGYFMAKLIIHFIHAVAEVINRDADAADRLKVAFYPDFNVKNAERIYPAADLSVQISLAGKEASGTGNMKFAMNGALTIGTLDGANIEIREAVGADNFFLFGLTAEEVVARRKRGYRPADEFARNDLLHEVIELIASGFFAGGDPNLFRPLLDSLLYHDDYFVLADFQPFIDCQERVAATWQDREDWTRKSILNVARIGMFSSDRAIREYCDRIWRVRPVPAVIVEPSADVDFSRVHATADRAYWPVDRRGRAER